MYSKLRKEIEENRSTAERCDDFLSNDDIKEINRQIDEVSSGVMVFEFSNIKELYDQVDLRYFEGKIEKGKTYSVVMEEKWWNI